MGTGNHTGKPDVAALKGRLENGDRGAWDEVLPALYPYAKAVAKQLEGTEHAEDREDIVQDAISGFYVFVRKGKFSNAAKWENFRWVLGQITRRRVADALRGKYRSPADLAENVEEPADSSPNPAEAAAWDSELLWKTVGELEPNPPVPELVREKARGAKNTELAERFGLNPNTVASYLWRAMQSLRLLLGTT